jgi:hypothetical protein
LESTDDAVIAMPDFSRARDLVGNAWTSVDTQGGQLIHRSARFPGAWSASALLLHSSTTLFVYCETVDWQGGERFTLRFVDAANEFSVSQLETARPPHAAIRAWPVDLCPPVEFFSKGPNSAKVGFGAAIHATGKSHEGKIVPILWCCFYSHRGGLMLYADSEIPLNVGIVTSPSSISAIIGELKADVTRQV